MFAVTLLVPLLTTAAPAGHLFDQVKAAQKCHSQENGSMECDFDLRSLHFGIAGVGDPDAGIAIYKADSEAEFHLSFGIKHGCLIIRHGLNVPSFDLAFVSPITGGVYRDWPSCQRAGLERRRR